jgi:hypothetical protein
VSLAGSYVTFTRASSPVAGVQDGEPDHVVAFVADDDVVVGELAVRRVARLLENASRPPAV